MARHYCVLSVLGLGTGDQVTPLRLGHNLGLSRCIMQCELYRRTWDPIMAVPQKFPDLQ